MSQGPLDEAHVLILPDLSRFAPELKAKLDAAFRTVKDPKIAVDPDLDQFGKKVKDETTRTERTTKGKIPIAPDLSRFAPEVRKFIARFDPKEQIKLASSLDRASFAKTVAEAKALAKAADPKIEVEVDIDRRNFLRSLVTPNPELFQSLRAPLARGLSTPLGLAIAGSLTQILSVTIPSAISLGLGGGLIALGAFALRGSSLLKTHFKAAGSAISESLRQAAQPLKGPFLQAIETLSGALIQLQPQLRGLFKALKPSIQPFVDGMTGFVKELLPGLQAAMPAVNAAFAKMGERLPGLGRTLGGVIAAISENLPAIQRGVDIFFTFAEVLLNVAGAALTLGQRISSSLANVGAFISLVAQYTVGLHGADGAQKDAARSGEDLANKQGEIAITAQKVATAVQAAADKAKELGDRLKELKKEWNDQIMAVRESIESYDGLIAKSDVTAKQVVEDLHNQVANFRTYSKDVKRLIKEGVSPAAIQELSKKGPEYVHALATGTNEQLQTYKRHWRERQAEVRGSFSKSMELQFADLKKVIKAMQAEINKLKDKTVIVTARGVFKAPKGAVQLPGGGATFSTSAQHNAQGGLMEGPGTKTSDSILSWLSRREFVQPAAATDYYGVDFMEAVRRRRLPRLPGFASGGLAEDARPGGLRVTTQRSMSALEEGIAAFDRNIDRFALALGKSLQGLLNFNPASGAISKSLFGGAAMSYIANFIREAGVAFQVISGFRPGARTRGTGSVSLHALGRALDLVGAGGSSMLDIWRAATRIPFKKEVIFSPAPFQVYGSGKHPGPPSNPRTRADHYNHVHVGLFDRGGFLMPGLTLADNRSGKPEKVTPAGRDALGRLSFGGGMTIENLIVQPLSGQFRLRDVMTELALQGVR
jgi:hypothetical protein